MTQIISRIAPTPSGQIHLGNAYNFLLTFLLTRLRKGKLLLRIDNYDIARTRDEYIDNIFEMLDWLSIDWDEGPQNLQDFHKTYNCIHRINDYRESLKKLTGTFTCQCSRKEISDHSLNGIYPGTCKDKDLDYIPHKNSIRLKWQGPLGDFIVWTKEDLPSYQLASTVDDNLWGINFIVRGSDLTESTQAQKYIAEKLNFHHFQNAKIIHHKLLEQDGKKLSKSKGDTSLLNMRSNGFQPKDIYHQFSLFFNLNVEELSLEGLSKALKSKQNDYL